MLPGAALTLLGALLLMAALNGLQAERYLAGWQGTGEEPDAQAFAAAEAAAIRAIRFYPADSGAHWSRLARIYDWRHWRASSAAIERAPDGLPTPREILNQPLGASGSASLQTTRLRALAAHGEAVANRPLWPYGVVRLAHARLRAGRADDVFARLLQQAFELGPWRPQVNRQITEAGLRGWHSLDRDTRDLVLENARRMARFSRADEQRVRELGSQAGLLPLLEVLVLP